MPPPSTLNRSLCAPTHTGNGPGGNQPEFLGSADHTARSFGQEQCFSVSYVPSSWPMAWRKNPIALQRACILLLLGRQVRKDQAVGACSPGHGGELGLSSSHSTAWPSSYKSKIYLTLKQIKWALTIREDQLGIPEQHQGSGSKPRKGAAVYLSVPQFSKQEIYKLLVSVFTQPTGEGYFKCGHCARLQKCKRQGHAAALKFILSGMRRTLTSKGLYQCTWVCAASDLVPH